MPGLILPKVPTLRARIVRHSLVNRDLIALWDHIIRVMDVDMAAAARRLDEIGDLMGAIQDNPQSGVRLSGCHGRASRAAEATLPREKTAERAFQDGAGSAPLICLLARRPCMVPS